MKCIAASIGTCIVVHKITRGLKYCHLRVAQLLLQKFQRPALDSWLQKETIQIVSSILMTRATMAVLTSTRDISVMTTGSPAAIFAMLPGSEALIRGISSRSSHLCAIDLTYVRVWCLHRRALAIGSCEVNAHIKQQTLLHEEPQGQMTTMQQLRGN